MRFDPLFAKVLILFLIGFFIISCKPNSKSASDSDSETTAAQKEPANQEMRNLALSYIQHRSQDGKTYAMMTGGFWNYQFVYDRGMSKPGDYDGHWLKFKDDFSYEYGLWDQTDGTGKYHFRLDDNMLVMLDDDPSNDPKEWEVKYGGDAMVFVGSTGFGNNGMQIKFGHSIEKIQKQ